MPCPVRDILYAGTKQNATGNPDTGYLQINEQVYLPEWLDRFNKNGKRMYMKILRSRSMHVSKTSFRR